MIKIKLYLQFLVQGLAVISGYSIRDFELREVEVDKLWIEEIIEKNPNYMPLILINSIYEKQSNKSYYQCLVNSDFELSIENNNICNNRINEIVATKLREIQENLERELKLITNNDIILPIGLARGHDEEVGPISVSLYSHKTSKEKTSNYNSDKYITRLCQRLNKNISIDSLNKLGVKNSRFERSLEFYFSSFDINNISVSFTLLFSSLEALFNIDKQAIANSIANGSSKILFLDKKNEKKMFFKIKAFYDKRSRYIHGNEPDIITEENEFDLREIVRLVILMYWQISIINDFSESSEIISFINKHDKDSINPLLKSFKFIIDDCGFDEAVENILLLIESIN